MNTPEGWKLVPVEPTPEMQSAAERYAGHHNRVPFSAGYYRAMLAAAPTPPEQPATQSCRKCGGAMHLGKALEQTVCSSDEGTCSPGGSGKLIDCLKCSACGWSVTTGKQPAAQGELTDEQIERATIAALSEIGAGAPWDGMTYSSGPYEVTKLRFGALRVLRAVIAADRNKRGVK
jgi:hypothetical protein